MKKIYLIFIFLLFPITLNAVSSDDVDYTVEEIYWNRRVSSFSRGNKSKWNLQWIHKRYCIC